MIYKNLLYTGMLFVVLPVWFGLLWVWYLKIEGTVSLQGKDIIQILGNQMIFGGSFIYYKKKSQGIAIKGITLDKWVG